MQIFYSVRSFRVAISLKGQDMVWLSWKLWSFFLTPFPVFLLLFISFSTFSFISSFTFPKSSCLLFISFFHSSQFLLSFNFFSPQYHLFLNFPSFRACMILPPIFSLLFAWLTVFLGSIWNNLYRTQVLTEQKHWVTSMLLGRKDGRKCQKEKHLLGLQCFTR